MQNWLRRWLPRGQDQRRQRRAYRPVVEGLEDRCLLAAPVVDPINFTPLNIPANKTLFVPVTATDTDGNPLTYTATSSNPQITVTPRNNPHPYLKISVAGFGDMVFQLFDDMAPNTVAIISGLAKSEFYNNLTFHRVFANFVIQGGDPNGNGTGGPGFTFDDEFNPSAIFSGNGQLAMANSGKDTNGSQFFVTVGPQRILDFNHTIFGQLVRGFDVLTRINQVPTDSNMKPLTPVVITSATIIQDTTDTVLSFKAAAGATGSSTITVTASDGKGGTSTQTFQVQAVADTTNDPPILGPVSNVTTPVNTPVNINLTSIDLENGPLVFEGIVQGGNGTATVNGNVVTVTPNAGFTGPIRVLVGVARQGASSRGSTPDPFDTQVITVGVGDLPIVATGTAVSATEGTGAIGVTVATFIDQDPNPVASDFSASINWGDGHVSTGTVTLGAAGALTVSGSNTFKEQGTYQVTVTITDRLGAVATSKSTATVADAQLTAQGVPLTGATGVPFTNTVVATFTDADPNGVVSDFTATINWGDGTSSAGTIAAIQAGRGFNVSGSHTYTTAGTFTITVAITDVNTAGDVPGSNTSVTSTATIQQPVATTTVLTVSPTGPTVFGQPLALSATVTPVPPGMGTPTGTVTFMDGTTALGTGTLDATGTATFNATALTAGTHSLSAVYNGGGIFTGSTSVTVTQTVNKADTTTTLTSSANPSTAGQTTTFTVVVTAVAPGNGTPTGTVTFLDGTTTLGTAPVGANGRATFQTSTLTVGLHTISATYAGDGNFNMSAATPLAQTVNAAPLSTNQTYVTKLYHDLLGREPDPQGLNTFSSGLDQNRFSRMQVATAIVTSDEARTHDIENLYQTLLGRQADPVGLDLSLRFLKAGGTLQRVRAVIAGSPEYFQSRSGSSNNGFLTSLYHDALRRGIDPVGQSLAGQALTAGVDRTTVAAVVFSSPEGDQVLVQSYYSLLLHRTADSVGMNNSTAALAKGLNEEQIIIAIGDSNEYFNRV